MYWAPDTTKTEQYNNRYFCPCCGHEMDIQVQEGVVNDIVMITCINVEDPENYLSNKLCKLATYTISPRTASNTQKLETVYHVTVNFNFETGERL